ncbi:MAG: gamma-glutamyltransferase [Gemmatimonadota bacterium]|nr:gamma-glutamyltransferase [Gemmatimonadota bacterium]
MTDTNRPSAVRTAGAITPHVDRMAIRAVLLALAALLSVACSRSMGTPAAEEVASTIVHPAFPEGWASKRERPPTVAEHGMVVTNSPLASEAGVEILRKGGNAVDAAVAVGFALEVTFPFAGNIGGGGFMVIRMADGRSVAVDYRETAPMAATRDMYIDNGKLTDKSTVGGLASGVPGSVAGMSAALAKYGTMSLHDVMQPAIRLASDGFVVDSALSRSLRGSSRLLSRFAGASVFLPNGVALQPGTLLKQPQLARTLTLIAKNGPPGFYEGPVANAIVAQMKRDGGIITLADLASYRPVMREPIVGSYRGYTLYAMPPSSSGGVTLVEILNQLETFKPLPAFNSAEYKHLLAETFQRAFVDRNTRLGDPAFVSNPIAHLTDKAYARQLASTISPDRATPAPAFAVAAEPMHTTHYSVVDAAGNAVSTTTTLNSGYGSGVYVADGGFFMNDEMDDFAAQPGKPNQFGLVQGEVNAVQPGKRMLSAMSPTIVLDPSGRLMMVVGAAGGPTIITGVAQVILNVIDQHMSLPDAMFAPRMHEQAWPDEITYEAGGISRSAMDSLSAMGHKLSATTALTNVNALMRAPDGKWVGVYEPRSTGAAVGY